jgi:enoyl-CoA hydratase
MPYSTIIYKKEGHIARVTLNRPEAKNAVDGRLAGELIEVCGQIRRDDSIYVVVLTGAGGAFCAGSEGIINAEVSPASAIARIEQPVVAAINGEASGWGLEMALSCDIRMASAAALFSMPQLKEGQLPADGGTQRLPRLVGRSKALELLLTGAVIDAQKALDIGMVNEIAPGERLLEEVNALAAEIAGKGPTALRFAKEAVNKGMDMNLEQGLRLEADLYFLLHSSGDRTEGIKAFLVKRKPRFEGR